MLTGAPDTALSFTLDEAAAVRLRRIEVVPRILRPLSMGQGALFLGGIKMSAKEKAAQYHVDGYNCAQSILAAMGEHTGLDEKTALAISAGFGGGLRRGEVCGAISGGLMAVGLACPFNDSSDTEAKQKIAKLAARLVNSCRDEFGAVRCAELKASGVSCSALIQKMAEITENMILENK